MALPFTNGLILRYDDTSTLWQDTAGTTPATANNATVSRINDMSGNGYHATLVNGTNAGVLKTSQYAQKSLSFNLASYTLGQPSGLVNILNGNAPFTIFAFYKPSNDDQYLFGKGFSSTIAYGFIGGKFDKHGSVLKTPPITDFSQPHTFGHSLYPQETFGNQRLFIAGAAVANWATGTNSSLGTNDTTSDIKLGGLTGYNDNAPQIFAAKGDLLSFLIYSRSLSPLEMLQLSDYHYEHFGVTNPRLAAPYHVAISGNSLCVLTGTPVMGERLRTQLGLPLGSVHNLAIGGQPTTTMITDDGARLDSLRTSLTNPVLLGWEGTNELVGATGDVAATHYGQWVDARAAAGWTKRVVGTILGRGGQTSFNTNRNIANTAIRGWATGRATIADVASDSTIGTDAASANTAFYGDGVHYTDAAMQYVDPYFKNAIQAQAATVTGPSAGDVIAYKKELYSAYTSRSKSRRRPLNPAR